MLIHLEKLGKSFGEKIVLHDVTASVEREDRIGKQNKVVWNSALMLDITWFWVVGIMPAAVDVYHDDISCKKQNMSVISIVRYCICRVN